MNTARRQGPNGTASESAARPAGLVALALLLLLPVAGCRPAAGPDAPTLRADIEVDPPSVFIGERGRAHIRITHPAGTHVLLPDPGADGVEWEWTGPAATRDAPSPGWRTTTRELHLLSFTVGEHRLFEGASFALVAPDGTESPGTLPEAVFRVASVLDREEAETPRDFKGLLAWRGPIPAWLWVLPLIALAAGAAGWLARRFLRRTRNPRPPPPAPPPHETALAALARLRASGTIETGPAEPFYRELSALVRRYIEDRFGLRAPERTTEEFIREAAVSGLLDGEQQARVQAFLVECDLVKFARFEPGSAEREAAWTAAERLVRETAEVPAFQGETP